MSLSGRWLVLVALVLVACAGHKPPKGPDGGPAHEPSEGGEAPSDGVLVTGTVVVREGGGFEVATSIGRFPLQKTCVIGKEALGIDKDKSEKGKSEKTESKVPVLKDRLVLVRPSEEDTQRLIDSGEGAPNYLLHSRTDDPRFGDQWPLENTGGQPWDDDPGTTVDESTRPADIDINAPEGWLAWAQGQTPKDVLVAVIDSGVAYDDPDCKTPDKNTGERKCMHRDLGDNVWVNPGECPIAGPTCFNGVDDDGNGYKDDVHGINAITAGIESQANPGKKVKAGRPLDDNGHGTWVAGVIDAVSDNKLDIAGIGRKTQLIICKFLNQYGEGDTCDAIRCLDYVAKVKTTPKTAALVISATNNSWGGGKYDARLRKAIEEQRDLGILFVAGAGNEGQSNDLVPFYPANYDVPNVISVAATDWWDNYWVATNYGRRVHLAAPGVNVRTLRPRVEHPCCDTPGCYHPGCVGGLTYTRKAGTSMAAAHVSGLAALVSAKQTDPQKDWAQVRNLILAGGVTLPSTTTAKAHLLTDRRIRAWDGSGRGSLSCSNQIVQKVLPPARLDPTASAPDYRLEVLSINCANPQLLTNAKVSVDKVGLSIVHDTDVTVLDNGTLGDLTANDGVFSGTWTRTSSPGMYRFTLLQTGDSVDQLIP